MSARFYRNPDGRGFAGGLPCQSPSEGGRPKRRPRDPRSGIDPHRGCDDRTYDEGRASRSGRIFLGSTAPPCAVAFTSSPFAHPIPQSRRRAGGDLFSGSLTLRGCRVNIEVSFQCIPSRLLSTCAVVTRLARLPHALRIYDRTSATSPSCKTWANGGIP